MAPILKAFNNFSTQLIVNIAATDTTMEVEDFLDGLTAPFRMTIYESDPLHGEIIEVTSIAGTLLYITRGVEGTTAQDWLAGSKVSNFLTAGMYSDLIDTTGLNTYGDNLKSTITTDYTNADQSLYTTVQQDIDDLDAKLTTDIFSGDYRDLTFRAHGNEDHSATFATTAELFSGSYNDLTNVPSTFSPESHNHDAANVTSGTMSVDRLPTTASRWPSWTEVTSKPSTFTPESHNHSATSITSGTLSNARLNSTVVLTNNTSGYEIRKNSSDGTGVINFKT